MFHMYTCLPTCRTTYLTPSLQTAPAPFLQPACSPNSLTPNDSVPSTSGGQEEDWVQKMQTRIDYERTYVGSWAVGTAYTSWYHSCGFGRPSTNHPATMTAIDCDNCDTTDLAWNRRWSRAYVLVPVPGTRSRLGSETKLRRPSLLQLGGVYK
jgi:hypothetical protein